MKRLSLAMMGLAIAGLMTMVSCRKPINQFNTTGEKITFSATTENNSKTYAEEIGGELYVKWEKGDEININGNVFTLVGEGGETSGSFTGNVAGAEGYFASYPATNDGSSVTFTVPATQDDNGTDLNGKIPMVAYTTEKGGNLQFHNMVNILQLNLTGTQAISKIEVSSTAENLSGSFTVGTDLTPTVINSGTTSNKITVTKSMDLSTSPTVYVVLPRFSSAESMVTVKFTGTEGEMTGSFKLKDSESGSEATTPNHRYTVNVAVSLVSLPYIPGDFTVCKSPLKKVNFAKGNLWAEWTDSNNPVFHLEANQWDYRTLAGNQCYISGTTTTTTTPPNNCGLFKWSDEAHTVTDNYDVNGELFCKSNFPLDGETWFTLGRYEWQCLTGADSYYQARDNASNLCGWRDVASVPGLVILPDGTQNPKTVLDGISDAASLAAAGAVFLPAAGGCSSGGLASVGFLGGYWSGDCPGSDPYYMYFTNPLVNVFYNEKHYRYAIRLVRLVQ